MPTGKLQYSISRLFYSSNLLVFHDIALFRLDRFTLNILAVRFSRSERAAGGRSRMSSAKVRKGSGSATPPATKPRSSPRSDVLRAE